jgi:defect-in-organelle-trafficking protein DotD
MNHKFSKFTFKGLVLAVALSLSACGVAQPIFVKDPQVVAPPDKVSALLADAAGKASNALENLSSVEQKRTPNATVRPMQNVPPHLARTVTVNWIGPADQILKMLANRASYRFQILGASPATPVVVNVDVTNKPVIEVLRSVGLQMGARANVRVDSTRQIVELQYAPNTGQGDVMQPAPMDGYSVQ